MNQDTYDYSSQYFEKGMLGWHQQSFGSITSLFDTRFRDKEISSILDFGAGDGFYGAFLNKYSSTVNGIDISDELYTNANAKFYKNFTQADLSADIKFDKENNILFSSEVIEHVLDYKSFLSNARAATEKDGHLFLTTTTYVASIFIYLISFPKKFKLKEIKHYFLGLFGNEIYRTKFLQNIWSWTKGHYHGFSKTQMKNALTATGWEVISIKGLKVQPLIYNEFFLNPFKNVRLRIFVVIIARICYGITSSINWIVKMAGAYSSNIIVIAKNSRA